MDRHWQVQVHRLNARCQPRSGTPESGISVPASPLPSYQLHTLDSRWIPFKSRGYKSACVGNAMAVPRGPQERRGDTGPPGFGASRTGGPADRPVSVPPGAGRSPKRENAGNVPSRAIFAIRVTQDRSGVKSKEGDIESRVTD